MANGLIFNIQRYSVHDGPGIRTTVFLKGCPLDCAWCHNPESIHPGREMVVMEGRCLVCGECRKACPFGGEAPAESALPVRDGRCTWCGACVQACPTGARQIVGREMRVDEVMQTVLRDRVFYDESGGGVTFSGGEPLMQPAFLAELLGACRAAGVRTAVDTCGMVSTTNLLAVAPRVDLFLYDLKLMDDERHRQYTGASNQLILDNLRVLGQVHPRIWIRFPLVPGVNDDPATVEATARFAASIAGVRQVNVLPFHRTGVPKAQRLGRDNRLADTEPPTAPQVEAAMAVFRKFGLEAKAGG